MDKKKKGDRGLKIKLEGTLLIKTNKRQETIVINFGDQGRRERKEKELNKEVNYLMGEVSKDSFPFFLR